MTDKATTQRVRKLIKQRAIGRNKKYLESGTAVADVELAIIRALDRDERKISIFQKAGTESRRIPQTDLNRWREDAMALLNKNPRLSSYVIAKKIESNETRHRSARREIDKLKKERRQQKKIA